MCCSPPQRYRVARAAETELWGQMHCCGLSLANECLALQIARVTVSLLIGRTFCSLGGLVYTTQVDYSCKTITTRAS